MKKLFAVLLSAALLTGCASKGTSSVISTVEETVTITNHADIQGTESDFSGYKWVGDTYADVIEITLAESIKFFAENGSGIVYYGYTGCPWCERALPVLNSLAKELDVTIYYVNVYGEEQPTREEYETLIAYLGDILETDAETGEKSFYVPLVLGFKDGEVKGYHVALVDSFVIEDEDSQMDDAQKAELRSIYLDIINSIKD